ncbi:YrzI family small protein [Peribacillus alkalitolerans]|nr:YrzI family small protein [Peribacillus alkalitolerans]
MTLNLILFTITIKTKSTTLDEAIHQENIKKMHEHNFNKTLEYRQML